MKPPHWAEDVFEYQPAPAPLKGDFKPCVSSQHLRGLRNGLTCNRRSKCFGPAKYKDELGFLSPPRTLFKQQFNRGLFSITCYCPMANPPNTRFLVRWQQEHDGEAQYSNFGINELCISRKKRGVLLTRFKVLAIESDGTLRGEIRDWCFVGFKCWKSTLYS